MVKYLKYIGGAIVALGTAIMLFFRNRNKVQYVDEEIDFKKDTYVEDLEEVVETTYEVLEVEKEQDEEFNNQVEKIQDEVDDMSNVELANYINEFLGISEDDNPISVTNDKSKFDWEREGSQDS